MSSGTLQAQLAAAGAVVLTQFCQVTRSSLQPGMESATRCPMSVQNWMQLSDLFGPRAGERSCARHCSTHPLSTACDAVQRGEADVALTVTDGCCRAKAPSSRSARS